MTIIFCCIFCLDFFSAPTNDAAGLAAGVAAFNDVASQTGVTAKLNSASNGIILVNEAGSNISIQNNSVTGNTLTVGAFNAVTTAAATDGTQTFVAGVAAAAAGGFATAIGYLEMKSEKGYSIANVTTTPLVTAKSSILNAVNAIDVSTVDGSTKALKIADAALAAVNGQRASFGALQSRFDTTVANLQSSSQNASAARSRIQDADFASETANLSRAQILQQAGTAMVAQANQLPQGILALLR